MRLSSPLVVKFFLLRFAAIFALLLLVVLGIFYYDMASQAQAEKSNIQVQQKALLKGKKLFIEQVISGVVKETALVADVLAQNKIYEQSGLNQLPFPLDKFESGLRAVSQRKEIYDQIRYLDSDGNEVVRVNFKDGCARVVSKEQLQNKKDRYYFKEAMKLDAGQIYISPLDLNVEHGQIEQPLKPMLRLATPIFDEQGVKRGVIVVNYLATYLMEGLHLFNLKGGANYMLINKQGYFLFNYLNPDLEFAFMFENKKAETIYRQFPDFAQIIRETRSGQFDTGKGILTIESVGPDDKVNPYCVQDYQISCNKNTAWKLLSFVALDEQVSFDAVFHWRNSLLYLVVSLTALLAYWLAQYQLRQYLDNQRIYYLAHNDSLTELLNRAAFQAEAEEVLQACAKVKNSVCLIYIDLDDFKLINDRFGHAAGDKALKHVAQAMNKVFGEGALLARLGGDEFAILLSSAEHMVDPKRYVKALLDKIQYPVQVKQGLYYQMNASIGGAYSSEEPFNLDKLMHNADMAMYQAKKAGKNSYCFI